MNTEQPEATQLSEDMATVGVSSERGCLPGSLIAGCVETERLTWIISSLKRSVAPTNSPIFSRYVFVIINLSPAWRVNEA